MSNATRPVEAWRYYRADRGQIVEVGRGIGRPPIWIVGTRNVRGSLRRIKSRRMPPVPDRQKCQANLDRYARQHGWQPFDKLEDPDE